MLASARQGAMRAPRLAAMLPVPVALPLAESSRQAQVRAMMPTDTSRRGYAAAAALSNARHAEAEAVSHVAAPAVKPRTSPRSTSSPTDSELTTAERFSRLVKNDSVAALRELSNLSIEDLSTVEMKDLRHLLYWANQDIGTSFNPAGIITREQATQALDIIRKALFAQPSRESDLTRDAMLGKNMRGRVLRGYLRLATNLGCTVLVAETFKERLEEQFRTGEKIIDIDSFALDLASSKKWTLIAELFPGPSERLPADVWTPEIVSIVIRANIALRRPQAAVDFFNALEHESIQPKALCAIVQAYLEVGDITAAQQAAHFAHKHDVPYRDVQMAILKGYKSLGHDADVEDRVRRGFQQLNIPLEAPILNAFIRLRFQAGDFEGAEAVLDEFRMFGRPVGAEPSAATAVLAITLFMRKQPPGQLNLEAFITMWNRVVETSPELVDDGTVAHLCRSLGRSQCTDDVMAIFHAAVHPTEANTPWKLPRDFVPDIVLANAVLEVVMKTKGYAGFLEVSRLMAAASIAPDDRTVIRVLEFAAQNLQASPPGLARLLRELNKRTGTPATDDQINVIMAEAVRASMRNPVALDRYLGKDGEAEDDGSIELRGELRELFQDRIEFLKKNRVTRGRALRTRLMYDTLATGTEPTNRSIRSTWHAFMLRGYRPGAKHYLSLMRAYADVGALKDAEQVLKLVAEDGIAPTTAMYTVLIHAHGRAGNVAAARNWYEAARRTPEGIDGQALCEMLHAYGSQRHPHKAVELARQDYAKVTITESVIVSVAHALRRNKDVPGAVFFIAFHTKRSDAADASQVASDQSAPASAPSSPADASTDAFADAAVPVLAPPGSTVPAGVTYILTPRLRVLMRKLVNWLGKQQAAAVQTAAAKGVEPTGTEDDRITSAFALAQEMLDDDSIARQTRQHKKGNRLSVHRQHLLADMIAVAGRMDGVRVEPRVDRGEEVDVELDEAAADAGEKPKSKGKPKGSWRWVRS